MATDKYKGKGGSYVINDKGERDQVAQTTQAGSVTEKKANPVGKAAASKNLQKGK